MPKNTKVKENIFDFAQIMGVYKKTFYLQENKNIELKINKEQEIKTY